MKRNIFRSNQPDKIFLILVGMLVLFGLAMLESASAPLGYAKHGDMFFYLKHQIFYGLLPGLILFLIFSRVDYHYFRAKAFPLLLVSIGLLILVFLPGLAANWGTSKSWIQLGNFSLQPAEIVKLTFLFYLAAWLEDRGHIGVKDLHTGLLPFLTVLGAIAGLLMLQPDTGTMSIIAATAVIVYFMAGAPLAYLAGIIAAGSGLFFFLIKFSPYRAARFLTFLNPDFDPQGIGYQINQAFLAIGSGGIFGAGLGGSKQKLLHLPEAASDSIFAVMAEELGFIFTLAFFVLLLAIFFRGLAAASSAPDPFGRLTVIGIISWFAVQSVVNMGAMLGLLPLTGVTLPFISYGGTSLAVSLAAVGVVANVSRQAIKQRV